MRKQTTLTIENSNLNGFGKFNVVGKFRINNRYYLIINQGNSLETRSSALASQVVRFEVDGQCLEIVEAENSPNLNSDIAALLTDRELQITTLVALGHCNKQIASRLRISEWTVSTHLRRIFAKLGVDSRAAMVYRCASLLTSI